MTTANLPAERANRATLIDQLDQMKGEIAKALPKHLTPDRFSRLVLTEMRKTPALAECTPASFFGSLLTASALGLEPGVMGECYLVPYKDKRKGITECQLIVGYQGVAKLFWQHPLAKRMSAEYVCERDEFDYDKGLAARLHHKPATGERGKVVAYYAIVELTTGAVQWDVFTPEQIQKLRRGKVGSSGDIPDPEKWMERKTALKQVMKLMPKAAQLAAVDKVDEQVGSVKVAQVVTASMSDGTPVNIETGEVGDELPTEEPPFESEIVP